MTPDDKKNRDPESTLPLTELWFNILLSLSDSPRHGYAMIKEMERSTGGSVSPATGTVYLALQRLEEDGMIRETDGRTSASKDGRRRRFYELTPFGRRVVALEAERMARQVAMAVGKNIVDLSSIK